MAAVDRVNCHGDKIRITRETGSGAHQEEITLTRLTGVDGVGPRLECGLSSERKLRRCTHSLLLSDCDTVAASRASAALTVSPRQTRLFLEL